MSALTYLQAVIIGAVQGVTELFPVSSLGHAVLLPAWIGGSWQHLVTQNSTANSEASPFLAFVVALHCATALALLVFYIRTWIRVIGAFFHTIRTRRIQTPTERLAWLVVFSTIPAGLTGLLLEHPLRTLFARPLASAIFLTINGLILIAGERLRRRSRTPETTYTSRAEEQEAIVTNRVSLPQAGVIGLAQTLALLAGISRSGVTMVAGMLRGLDRESAVNFSFLLATPIIFAAGVLKLPSLTHPDAAAIRGPVLAGAAVAFVAALVSVKFLTKYFERRSLYPFAVYCLLAGIASIIRFA
ncbi:MAG: undecaprenyl-diphosphate phosphatase [Microlunatus sp.]|nr:undecaprenyl-diphosphate phosphatase [Microlunatus sp.]